MCSSVQGNNKQDFPILADRTKALQRTSKKEKEVAAFQKKWQPPGGGWFSLSRPRGPTSSALAKQCPKTSPWAEPQFNQF